jgi:translocation and assembly module TamA
MGGVEWQRPLIRNGPPSEFENTFDAGAVGDTAKDLRVLPSALAPGCAGSPIGPLQMDPGLRRQQAGVA